MIHNNSHGLSLGSKERGHGHVSMHRIFSQLFFWNMYRAGYGAKPMYLLVSLSFRAFWKMTKLLPFLIHWKLCSQLPKLLKSKFSNPHFILLNQLNVTWCFFLLLLFRFFLLLSPTPPLSWFSSRFSSNSFSLFSKTGSSVMGSLSLGPCFTFLCSHMASLSTPIHSSV